MIKIKDGRTELYQWDTGSVLTVDGGIDELHFAVSPVGRSIKVPVVNGEAKVEDVLLQIPGKIHVWGFVGEADNGYTKVERVFAVRQRNKPADYVFTPPEQTTLAVVMSMIEEIPKRIESALTAAKESGEFDGAPGKTPIKSVDYFTPEEVQEIVDEAAEKAADMVDVPGGGITQETDPTVPAWAKEPEKPTYTADEVGARPNTWMPTAAEVGADDEGTADRKVSAHNTSESSHNDIRLLIEGLTSRLNALANSTDEDLDQMAEIVAYIKSNKSLIDSITTSKISVTDIIDNLTTSVSNKPLSAKMGVQLKSLIDAIKIPTSLPASDVYDWAKQPKKPSYTASEVGALPASTEIPENTSDLTNDSGYITIAVATLLNYYLKGETYAKNETYSQTEIDNLISGLDNRLKAIADSDDTTLDQLSEIVVFIKSNKSLIDSITTSKVNVSDIVNNLTTADEKKPLSAAQGKELKTLYDSLPSWAKASSKPTYSKSEVGLGNVDNVKQYSASNPPPYPVKSVNGKTGDVQLSAADVGAATSQQFDELSETIVNQQTEINGKLKKNFGSANVGKILVVGTDGNLVLTDMPEGGVSGDVVGVFDENNNILLSGDIADGTYPLKFKLDDDTYADAGTLTVNRIVAPSYTNILTSGKYEIQLNKRWSASSKAYSASNGMISVKIPIGDVWDKTIYIKGFEEDLKAGSNAANWYALASDGTKVTQLKGYTGSSGGGIVWECVSLQTLENGVYGVPINSTTITTQTNVTHLMVNIAAYSSTAIGSTIPDTFIMTIDEEIV